MIIYNVTIKTDWSIYKEWLLWMQNEHIPDVMASGCFFEYNMMRLLETDDTEGPTFAIQYHADSLEDYNRYVEKFSISLRDKSSQKWGEKSMAFRSLLETVK